MFNHPIGSNNAPQKKMAKMAQGAPVEEMEQGEQDGSQVAAEHGPAVEVHHTHEHEMGAHHVHSIHADGHEHHSDHGSVDEALAHHKKVAGGEEHGEGDTGYEEKESEGY